MRTFSTLLMGMAVTLCLNPAAGAQTISQDTMFFHFIGVWKTAGEVKPVNGAPAGAKFTVQETTRPVLKGTYILSREHSHPDGKKSLWLMTLDKTRNIYPFWMFDSDGLLGCQWELT